MKNRGIVLSSIDYKEASKIVYLYTPMGKISVKAQGANKPKNGLLGFITTGNIVSFVITDSDFPQVVEYEIERSLLISEENLKVLEAVMVIFEVIKYLPDDINHQKTYPFIENILLSLNSDNYLKLLAIFLIKITYSFGVAPNLKSCTKCNSTINLVGFDVYSGGAVCKNCSGGSNLELLRVMKEYYYDKKDLSLYSDYNFKELLILLNNYYKAHIHIGLRLNLLLK